MSQGFVQLNPDVDATGKQLDNDTIYLPVGTVINDQFGNQSVLTSPIVVYRERVVLADPNNPAGLATVRAGDGPKSTDYGATVRLPPYQSDLQDMLALLMSIDANMALISGGSSLVTADHDFQYIDPVQGMPPGIPSKDVPRRAIGDIFGRQIIVPHSSREAQGNANIVINATTSPQTLVAAGGNGIYTDIFAVTAMNSTSTGGELDISDGTQTIPLWLPPTDTRGISLGGVLIKATNPNTAWTATTPVSISGNVKIWCAYVQNRQI